MYISKNVDKILSEGILFNNYDFFIQFQVLFCINSSHILDTNSTASNIS